jgi:ComF family protein
MHTLRELASAVSHLLMDHVFPPHCPACMVPVSANGNLCAACFASLHRITAPLCECCGIPFSVPMETGSLCPECIATPPEFDVARAVMVYNHTASTLISALKYHDRMGAIARYAQQMQQAGADMLEHADALIPVPLHWRRLLKRRYNQSAWLAYALAERTGIACQPNLLTRIRNTTQQTGMKRSERQRNMRRAFAVKHPEQIAGKRIVLIDDVVTTGATANACARALKDAGAAWVGVLSIARTVRE